MIGIALLLGVSAVAALVDADENGAYFFGRPVASACFVRVQYGVPCPNCGLTRSTVMAARGEWRRAWRVAASGPALVGTALSVGLLLILLGGVERWGGQAAVARARRSFQTALCLIVAAGASLWLGGWLLEFERCLKRG